MISKYLARFSIPAAVVIVLTCALSLAARQEGQRRASIQGTTYVFADFLVDHLLSPYAAVYLWLPVGIGLAVMRGVPMADGMGLIRWGSYRRAHARLGRELLRIVLLWTVCMIIVAVLAGWGLPLFLPSRDEGAFTWLIPWWVEILARFVLIIVSGSSYMWFLSVLAMKCGSRIGVVCAAAMVIVIVISFKHPELFPLINWAAPFNPLSSLGNPRFWSVAHPIFATLLGVWVVGHWRDKPARSRMLLSRFLSPIAIGILVLLFYASAAPEQANAAQDFHAIWYGVEPFSPNLISYLQITLLSFGPILVWLYEYDRRIDGGILLELIRYASFRRWIWHEFIRAFGCFALSFLLIVTISMRISFLRPHGGAVDISLHLSGSMSLVHVILFGLANGAFCILLVLLARMLTGSVPLTLVALSVALALGFIFAGKGFPMAQMSLGMADAGSWLMRAAILVLSIIFLGVSLSLAFLPKYCLNHLDKGDER